MSIRSRTLILLNFILAVLFVSNAQGLDSGNTGEAPSNFRLIKTAGPDPQYPRKALRSGVEGWVDLRFTVAPNGQVEDIEIIGAKPRRVFERGRPAGRSPMGL